MKKVINFIIDTKEDGSPKIDPEIVGKFLRFIQNKLGDEYLVFGSPMIMQSLHDEEDVFYNCDMKLITFDEVKNLAKI